MNEVVSIIMPMYNSEKYITESIKSVINQTYKLWKLYVIDDCSKDRSIKKVEEFQICDSRIVLIKSEINGGPAKARNKGLKICGGRFITFIDSDDVWNEKFLEKQLKFLKEKNAGIVFSSFERKSENLEKSFGISKIPSKVNYKMLLMDNCITCLTVLIDSEKIGKKYFNEEYYHEDYIMWLEILRESAEYAYGNQETLAIYRIRQGSVCRNKMKSLMWRWIVYRRIENLGVFESIYNFLIYTVFGVSKSYRFIFMK